MAPLLLDACEPTPEEPARYSVAISAARDDGAPLAGVAVQIAGRDRGFTDSGGRLEVEVAARPGARAQVVAHCPAGFREARYPAAVTLRRFRKLEEQSTSDGIPIAITCLPSERTAVLVVRTDGRPNLPVVVNGRELARTDRSGAAHLHFKLPLYGGLRVALDTAGRPELMPQSPQLSFQIGDADEILIFDQPFSIKEPPKPVRRAPRRKKEQDKKPEPPKPTRPVKIG
jgi:hypothetical protein